MTDDIVARLREEFAEQIIDEQPQMVADTYKKERHEAADEIDRLRAWLRDIALFSPYKHSSTLRRKARAALEGEASDDAAT